MTTNQLDEIKVLTKEQKVRFWAFWLMIMSSLAVLGTLMLHFFRECA